MGDIVVTREQVKDLIKAEGLKPSDLFEMDALGSDPVVRGYADDLVKERIGRAWREKQEAKEELEKSKAKLETEKADLVKQIGDLKLNAAKSQLGSLLDKQKAERKLDDRQVKFVQTRLSRFAPKNPDEIEKEFTTYLDDEVGEYSRLAQEVFGIDKQQTEGDGKGKPGAETSEAKKQTGLPANLDPAKNEFLKIDRMA